jgi:RND family efflux transporter MFP subunit
MLHIRILLKAGLVFGLAVLAGVAYAQAQPGQQRGTQPSSGSDSAADPSAQVVIQREAPKLIEPDAYQAPLYLEPRRTLALTPLVDGIVSAVLTKPGQKVTPQAEAIRLDPAELQLIVERAKANHRAAQIEAKIAGSKGDGDQRELAEAKLQAAKADLDLAELRLQRATVRVPFAAEVLRVHVIEGELVRAGQPAVTIGDTSAMKVEIPVDRQTQPGQSIELRVEDRTVQGKVETILPLSEKFEPLRDLINSAASAVVIIDNAGGEWKPGQTVYASLIPQHPVAQVPTAAVQNGMDGTRKVQVVRDSVVRDISVEVLSSVGNDRVYVSGPLVAGDEVVVTASQPLPDGTQIRPAAAELAAESADGGRGPQPPRTRGGF